MTAKPLKYPFLDLGAVNAPILDEVREALERVALSGRYIGGQEVERFEYTLGQLLPVRHVVALSNGLDALRLMLRAYVELRRLSRGDEVLVPANTYIATILAITDAGVRPVLVDCDPTTYNLPLEGLETYLSPRTKAIMNVHLYGRANHTSALEHFALRHGLLLLEDNAQAIGAQWADDQGKLHYTASGADAAAFSFYPTKNIGALGDAGALTTDDPRLADTVRALANYGALKRYHNTYQGFNCRMDPMQAAVLSAKLPYLESQNRARRENAVTYLAEVRNPAITLPRPLPYPQGHVWHQFVVQVDDRRRFTRFLDDNSIGWDIHYATPPHLQPCYSGVHSRLLSIPQPLTATEQLASRCVSLPISPATTPGQISAIATILNSYTTV